MPWKVSAYASNADGRCFKVVAEGDGDPEEAMEFVPYWVRNMEPGEMVVVNCLTPGIPGK